MNCKCFIVDLEVHNERESHQGESDILSVCDGSKCMYKHLIVCIK